MYALYDFISSPEHRSCDRMTWIGVRPSNFSLNIIFSRTTIKPIISKLDRKHAWVMMIQICSNKGAFPFWGPIRGKIRKKFDKSSKNLLINHWPEFIEIKLCSNKVHRVMYDPTPGA